MRKRVGAPGQSRWRTERRNSPEAAETISGASKENLCLARERSSASSGTPTTSVSRCVAHVAETVGNYAKAASQLNR